MLKRADGISYRPAHIHFIVTAPGFRPIVTHLFMAGDRYLDLRRRLRCETEPGRDTVPR